MLLAGVVQGREPMRSMWVAVFGLGIMIAVTAGCRTVPPELKPPKQPEVLSEPPAEARYNTSIYPKEAFNTPDLFKKKDDNGIMPARGGSGSSMGNAANMMNQQQRGPMN
jgi:hypothetical protein